MDNNYYCKPGLIEPMALIGQNVLVLHDQRWYLYRIVFQEGVSVGNALMYDAGALAALGQVTQASLTAILDMYDLEIFQFRMRVLDDIRVTVFQPLAYPRSTMANVIGTITPFSHLTDPCDHLTEKAIYYNRRIYLTTLNPTDYAITQARTIFWGFRHQVQALRDFASIDEALASGERWAAIVAQGAASRAGVSFG